MRFGGFCKECKGLKKCKKVFSQFNCFEMPCVICNGAGCKECNTTGKFDVLKCPLLYLTREVDDILNAADLYLEHGLPVVGTCQMDQAYNFTEVCRFVRRDVNRWKNDLGIIG